VRVGHHVADGKEVGEAILQGGAPAQRLAQSAPRTSCME
jgi:hypothetical protein